MMMKHQTGSISFFLLCLLALMGCQSQEKKSGQEESIADEGIADETNFLNYQKGALLHQEDFSSDLDSWVVEAPQNEDSKVVIADGKLLVDVNEGTTIWFDQKLFGDILIEYDRKVIMDGGKNDRLSDLNSFWMATDPWNETLFTRSGLFPEYDSLLMYYAGIGGNYNKTTRFRKYTGNGERVLHSDLQDQEHLLEPNKDYNIKIIVYDGVTKFFMNNEEYFSFEDPDPLREGYFGFRTTKSRHVFDNFKVYRLE